MLSRSRSPILGKIAAPLDRALARRATHGAAETIASTTIAAGDGWRVADSICTAGPHDHPFEEAQDDVSVAVVLAGTFQFRSPRGEAMLTPGSLFLANPGECFACGHEHAAGDRCVSFHFTPAFFEQLTADTGRVARDAAFRLPGIPPIRALASLAVRVAAGASGVTESAWDELALEMAAAAVQVDALEPLARGGPSPSRRVMARVTETVRRIEVAPEADAPLARLAAEAGQSPYHYLRVFRQITGVTPHQYVLRTRLRAAAARLLAGDEKVIHVALASGFEDLSNFNRAFRREFSITPRAYRRRGAR